MIRLGAITDSFAPHELDAAIIRNLTGDKTVAKNNRVERRALLERAGMDITELANIGYRDAALCAWIADYVLEYRNTKLAARYVYATTDRPGSFDGNGNPKVDASDVIRRHVPDP